MNRQAGFTLLEVLLSVAIIGMLMGASLPIYESFAQRNDLEVTTESTVSLIRRAETYARNLNGDSDWSVEFAADAITLFKGTDFSGRDTSYDETLSAPASITLGGLSEISFTKFTAAPDTTGSVTLTSNTSDVNTVTINAKGTVDY
jgi:prepilin-type N-terminal cleavage/methylation domain-containing protein